MKISIEEMYNLVQGKKHYDAQKQKNFDVTLLLVSNMKLIQEEIEKFEQARDELIKSDEFKEYEEKRNEIIASHRKVNAEGDFELVQENGQQGYRLDDLVGMNKKLMKLDDENGSLLSRLRDHQNEINDRKLENVEVPLKKFTKAEQVKMLSKNTMVALAPLIEVKLTKKMLTGFGDDLTTEELERILDYCEIA